MEPSLREEPGTDFIILQYRKQDALLIYLCFIDGPIQTGAILEISFNNM